MNNLGIIIQKRMSEESKSKQQQKYLLRLRNEADRQMIEAGISVIHEVHFNEGKYKICMGGTIHRYWKALKREEEIEVLEWLLDE